MQSSFSSFSHSLAEDSEITSQTQMNFPGGRKELKEKLELEEQERA